MYDAKFNPDAEFGVAPSHLLFTLKPFRLAHLRQSTEQPVTRQKMQARVNGPSAFGPLQPLTSPSVLP